MLVRPRSDYDLYARNSDYDVYARSDDGIYLSARDLNTATLLARDLLYARLDEPKREHYATKDQWEKAWKSWNRHNGEILREHQKTLAKQGLKFKLNTKVLSAEKTDDKVNVKVESAKGGNEETVIRILGLVTAI